MDNELNLKFKNVFGKECEDIFTSPGRSEIGGNHTDHQHGKVLAAAINLVTKAAVRKNGINIINVYSEGYGMSSINLNELNINIKEFNTTPALIRGVAAAFSGKMPGMTISEGKLTGFDAYVTSEVLQGSGLSSSASFEVLISAIENYYGNFNKTAPELARISQFAENVYFGKPCGLMDQTACAVGNMISIDFMDTNNPVITPIDFDFSKCGYALCIIDSGADHADLTDEYAAIPAELKTICNYFGKDYLRDVDEKEFYENAQTLRKQCGDRAFLRAIHVFEDNKRVDKEIEALNNKDFSAFLKLVSESGTSSYKYLQNVIVSGAKQHQEVAVALALAEHALCGKGACRVQGGGFAGTIEAFVPEEIVDEFITSIEKSLGKGCCHVLSIRKNGAGICN